MAGILQTIFSNVFTGMTVTLNFNPGGPIDESVLFQVMAWRRAGDKLSPDLKSPTPYGVTGTQWVNTLRPRQNGRLFADDTFKCIFLNENIRISIKISLKLVPKVPINNIPALVQIMAWHRPGDKPLSEPMMVSFPTHICFTQPQWVKHTSV